MNPSYRSVICATCGHLKPASASAACQTCGAPARRPVKQLWPMPSGVPGYLMTAAAAAAGGVLLLTVLSLVVVWLVKALGDALGSLP